jgi:hypothetical protein
MKTQLASSQRVKVRIKEYEDADIVALVGSGKVEEVTIAVNADRRQKEALVNFRKDLVEKIEALGYKRPVESVEKDGKTVETPTNTEGEDIKLFVDGLTTGNITVTGFERPSGDDKVQETAALAFLQTLAFQCGDEKDESGNPCYVLDVTRPVSTPGAKGAIPKWAMEAAGNIIKNNSTAKWITNFTNGYTSASGIVIDPIPFESFVQHAHAHATPEEKEALHQSNIKRLAAAIQAVRKQEDAKRAPEFV